MLKYSANCAGRVDRRSRDARRGVHRRHGPRPSMPSRFIFRQSVVAETPSSRATRPRSPSQRASAASMARRSASSTASARVRAALAARGRRRVRARAGRRRRGSRAPGESAAACSIAFSSSRTLPGQAWLERAARPPPGVSDLPVAGALVEALQEVGGEERHVLAALAERRDPDRHHVEPVVEVLAEAALRDRAARGPGSSRR